VLPGDRGTSPRLAKRPQLGERFSALTFHPPQTATVSGPANAVDDPSADNHQEHSNEHPHDEAENKHHCVPRHCAHSSARRMGPSDRSERGARINAVGQRPSLQASDAPVACIAVGTKPTQRFHGNVGGY
jgi:hypothetical protein